MIKDQEKITCRQKKKKKKKKKIRRLDKQLKSFICLKCLPLINPNINTKGKTSVDVKTIMLYKMPRKENLPMHCLELFFLKKKLLIHYSVLKDTGTLLPHTNRSKGPGWVAATSRYVLTNHRSRPRGFLYCVTTRISRKNWTQIIKYDLIDSLIKSK